VSPSRLRLPLLLLAALVVVLVPSVALAKSAGTSKGKDKGRSAAASAWTWSKALSAGRYDVTIKLKKVAGRRAGVDVLQVSGPDGKARQLDPAALRAATARFTVAVPAKKLALRFVVRRGKPVVLSTTVAAVGRRAGATAPAAPTSTKAAAKAAAPAPAATSAAGGTTASTAAPAGATPITSRRLLFDDEFDGAAGGLPSGSAWDPQEGAGWGTGQLQSYTARTQNVKLDGAGNLALVARKESYRGEDGKAAAYTSARLQTKDRFSFTYGRVEARIKVPSGTGLWPAFWMLGDDIYSKGWPESGEIDVMETIGSLPKELNGTVHAPQGAWSGAPDVDGAEWTRGEIYTHATSLSDAYHVYAAEWKPGAIDFSIDGKVYFTIAKAQMPGGGRWTFDHPNHLLLNLAVGGEWPGAPTSTTPFPSTMLVDWVRVYAPQS
jgi:beta-glucanase (GH16 family)